MKTKTLVILAALGAGAYYFLKQGGGASALPFAAQTGRRPLAPAQPASPDATATATSSQTPGVASSTTLSGTCFARHALSSKGGMGSLG